MYNWSEEMKIYEIHTNVNERQKRMKSVSQFICQKSKIYRMSLCDYAFSCFLLSSQIDSFHIQMTLFLIVAFFSLFYRFVRKMRFIPIDVCNRELKWLDFLIIFRFHRLFRSLNALHKMKLLFALLTYWTDSIKQKSISVARRHAEPNGMKQIDMENETYAKEKSLAVNKSVTIATRKTIIEKRGK